MGRVQIKFNQRQVFEERGKPEYPGKTSQSREENQQTQPTYDNGWKSNPGHIGERRVL